MLSNTTTSPLLGAINAYRPDKTEDQANVPKAYLNWILLDEQFKYVSGGSGAQVVGTSNNTTIQSLAPGIVTVCLRVA